MAIGSCASDGAMERNRVRERNQGASDGALLMGVVGINGAMEGNRGRESSGKRRMSKRERKKKLKK